MERRGEERRDTKTQTHRQRQMSPDRRAMLQALLTLRCCSGYVKYSLHIITSSCEQAQVRASAVETSEAGGETKDEATAPGRRSGRGSACEVCLHTRAGCGGAHPYFCTHCSQ